jgi:cell wall-associated NlpC family hydrolase
MSVVEAVARVTQLQSELAALRVKGTPSTTSADSADAFAAVLGTTAATPAAQSASPTAAGGGATGTGGSVTGAQIVQDAEKYLGVPYVFGGESTSGMDCSGLVQKVLGDLGISAPRVVQDQAKIGTPVASLADAQPGDLIVEKGNGHIQIYAGNGMIIEAPKPGENVVKRKEWLSAAQIGTIRRVAQPAQAPQPGQLAQAAQVTAPAHASPAPQAAKAAQATQATPDAQLLSALLAPAMWQAQPEATDAAPARPAATADAATASVAAAMLQAGAGTAAPALLPAAAPAPVAAPAAPSAPTPAPALLGQLSGPVTQLVTQPDGSHTVVVRVVPEQLGPVTVDAHLTDHGLHIELTAPTDAGRDALAGVLGDLRRDLAAGGITANVSLGSAGSGTAGDGQAQQSSQQAVFELLDEHRSGRPLPRPAATAAAPTRGAASPDSILDVLA